MVTSLLPHAERDSLKEVLAELGGTQLAEWAPAVNYLVMSSFKITVKVTSADIVKECSFCELVVVICSYVLFRQGVL